MLDMNDVQKRMDGAVNAFENELKGLRTGRASTGLVEGIMIDAYGSKMPLNQVASLGTPDPRTISVQVWDQGMVPSVEKAIRESDLGLNPSSDGALIRIPTPELSEDRRKEMVKIAGKYAENARVAVRNVRRDAMDTLKKAQKEGEISEDEMHGKGEDIQKQTDKHVARIDEALASKEKDIMTV